MAHLYCSSRLDEIGSRSTFRQLDEQLGVWMSKYSSHLAPPTTEPQTARAAVHVPTGGSAAQPVEQSEASRDTARQDSRLREMGDRVEALQRQLDQMQRQQQQLESVTKQAIAENAKGTLDLQAEVQSLKMDRDMLARRLAAAEDALLRVQNVGGAQQPGLMQLSVADLASLLAIRTGHASTDGAAFHQPGPSPGVHNAGEMAMLRILRIEEEQRKNTAELHRQLQTALVQTKEEILHEVRNRKPTATLSAPQEESSYVSRALQIPLDRSAVSHLLFPPTSDPNDDVDRIWPAPRLVAGGAPAADDINLFLRATGKPEEQENKRRDEAEAEQQRLDEADEKHKEAKAQKKRREEAEAEQKRLDEAERKRKEAETQKKRREEAETEQKRLDEAERKRKEVEAEQKRLDEAERRRALSEGRDRLQRKEAETQKKRREEAEAEQKRLDEAERKRKEAEAQKKQRDEAEAEQKRLDEAERKRKEAEAQKNRREEVEAEQKRLDEAEKKRKEAEAQKKRRDEAEAEQKRLDEAERKRKEVEAEQKRLRFIQNDT